MIAAHGRSGHGPPGHRHRSVSEIRCCRGNLPEASIREEPETRWYDERQPTLRSRNSSLNLLTPSFRLAIAIIENKELVACSGLQDLRTSAAQTQPPPGRVEGSGYPSSNMGPDPSPSFRNKFRPYPKCVAQNRHHEGDSVAGSFQGNVRHGIRAQP